MSDELWSCRVKIYDAGNQSPISECDVVVSFSKIALQEHGGLRIHGLNIEELAGLKRAFVSTAIEEVLRERLAFTRCEKCIIKPTHAAAPRTPAIKARNGVVVWVDQ